MSALAARQSKEAPVSRSAHETKLEVDDVAIGYYSERQGSYFQAVQSLSFTVPGESLVALIGPSGCGKSTFLRAVSGLLPYQRGRLLVDNSLVKGPRSDCALVFQSPTLLPWRTVSRNIGYGLEMQGTPKGVRESRVHDMMNLVGLEAFADRYPRQLSGGMQQRANLARALVTEPVLLLLDEPFSAVDAQTRDHLGEELLRIRRATRQTMLLVTHQVEEAILLADSCVVLSKGPGSVVAEIFDIPLGRDQPIVEKRADPRFASLVGHLRGLLASASSVEA